MVGWLGVASIFWLEIVCRLREFRVCANVVIYLSDILALALGFMF